MAYIMESHDNDGISDTMQERIQRTMDLRIARVATLTAIMDGCERDGVSIPDDVAYDYEVAVSRACAYSDYWGMDYEPDC